MFVIFAHSYTSHWESMVLLVMIHMQKNRKKKKKSSPNKIRLLRNAQRFQSITIAFDPAPPTLLPPALLPPLPPPLALFFPFTFGFRPPLIRLLACFSTALSITGFLERVVGPADDPGSTETTDGERKAWAETDGSGTLESPAGKEGVESVCSATDFPGTEGAETDGPAATDGPGTAESRGGGGKVDA